MSKADKIIDALIAEKAVSPNINRMKAKEIILRFLEETHSEAVTRTIMSGNKITFNYPKFSD